MRKLNDALDQMCSLLDSIKMVLSKVLQVQCEISRDVLKVKEEAVEIADLLEDQNEQLDMLLSMPGGRTVEVKPVETTDGKSMFLVSGDELANLLQACSGATVRMKKEAEKK